MKEEILWENRKSACRVVQVNVNTMWKVAGVQPVISERCLQEHCLKLDLNSSLEILSGHNLD